MKILISIEHPAWAHQFKYIIKKLEEDGHRVKVLAVDKDRDLELLDIFNIKYEVISNSAGKNILEKAFIFLFTTIGIFIKSLKFKPDIFIGRASPMIAINSLLFGKPHIIFEDTERATISLFFCKLFSTLIITPKSFFKNLGKKQMRVDTYKEIFYLHKNYFTPDGSILRELRLPAGAKFVIIRFVAWDASHDIGKKGLLLATKHRLINELGKTQKVFISSESKLPAEFEKYQLNISPEKIHHILYYASLVITEGASVASESAVLGTHAIYVNPLTAGTTNEQESKYNLVHNFFKKDSIQKDAIGKALELINKENLWEDGKKKREILLKDKFDPVKWMVWLIENYPDSAKIMRQNPDFVEGFK